MYEVDLRAWDIGRDERRTAGVFAAEPHTMDWQQIVACLSRIDGEAARLSRGLAARVVRRLRRERPFEDGAPRQERRHDSGDARAGFATAPAVPE